ncbi:hypothetical protein KFU94_47000 [Chloroflexi bacterium TSY]|nr:hypothetical protein [Chloroflexi bacterium TSY]
MAKNTLNPQTIERRISEGVVALNVGIRLIRQRPDLDPAGSLPDVVYLVRDIFTTVEGSWEPTDHPHSIPLWARNAYLKPFGAPDWFDDAGANHHLFAAVLGLDGALIPHQEFLFWSDGFERLDDPNYQGYMSVRTKERSGWANLPLGPGSSFNPERNEIGPWCWAPSGVAEVVVGGGLPLRHHVSTFVVWRAIRVTDLLLTDEDDGLGSDTPDQDIPILPVDPDESDQDDVDQNNVGRDDVDDDGREPDPRKPDRPGELPSLLERRIGDWATRLNITVRPISERPDAFDVIAETDSDVVFLLKDLFTTRDGSWEQSEIPGAVPDWAREYLRPLGAPDYFDDAGGDRHLFAAVIGLDGQLLKGHQIRFWSDGFAKLGDPSYTDYIYRKTKEHSGWINIPIGPGSSFVPERNEAGPWCWAPEGASDVVCGGGLPANQHISTFAVWQAVRRQDLVTDEDQIGGDNENETDSDKIKSDEGRTSIFLPFITTSSQPEVDANETDEEATILARRSLPTARTAIRPSKNRSTPADDASSLLMLIRAAAWNRIGIEFKVDSALAQYARQHGLGMPVTQEFEANGYRVQGYYGGIVYAHQDNWERIDHVSW